jgi:hypothetical protein
MFCENCGKEFIPGINATKKTKYCPDCRKHYDGIYNETHKKRRNYLLGNVEQDVQIMSFLRKKRTHENKKYNNI